MKVSVVQPAYSMAGFTYLFIAILNNVRFIGVRLEGFGALLALVVADEGKDLFIELVEGWRRYDECYSAF